MKNCDGMKTVAAILLFGSSVPVLFGFMTFAVVILSASSLLALQAYKSREEIVRSATTVLTNRISELEKKNESKSS